MTDRYAMRPTATGDEQKRAETVTMAFLDALQDAAEDLECNPAEVVAGTAYALASLVDAAEFEGAREIVMRIFETRGTASSPSDQ